jgi:PAS domain S-box-containing protein
MAALTINDIRDTRKLLGDENARKMEIVANSFDSGIEGKRSIGDDNFMETKIQKLRWMYPEIRSIKVWKIDEEIISRAGAVELAKRSDEAVVRNFGEELVVAAPIHSGGQVIGVVEMVSGLEQIEKEIRAKIFEEIIFYTVTMVLIVAIFFVTIDRVIINPIRAISNGAQKMAAGELKYRVEVKSKDEIGRLAESFNEMGKKLGEYYQDLEREIKDKTGELNKRMAEIELKNQNLERTKKAMLNLLEDIQEEKDLVARERAKDEALLESMGDGVVAMDQTGIIIYANKAALGLLKVTSHQAMGKHFAKLWRVTNEKGVEIPLEERPIYQALTDKTKVSSSNYYYERGDKVRFPVASTASPIILEEKVFGAIMIFRDITHEREVDRMKTEFISLASHQLRTPLSAIKWYLEMLLNGDAGKLGKEQKEFVENIDQSNERLIALVNGLLNISRIESGRIMIDPKPTNLGDLIRSIVKEFEFKLEEKGIELVVSVHNQLEQVNVDPKLIGEVYKNLISNAIKYTPKGGEIMVMVSKKGQKIVSQVTDTGYGIPLKEQGKVFQKFFRAENIIKVETDGTGLGLYLVKAIVESSGGKIWFKSDEGKGTTFWFSFPSRGVAAKKGEVTINS